MLFRSLLQRIAAAIPCSLLLCFFSYTHAQTFSGRVIDESTGEGLPFVNILVKGTEMGAFTDVDGNYALKIGADTATLVFTYLGYAPSELKQREGEAASQVNMKAKDVQIEEVLILPDYSYDEYLFKQILAHKKENNPDNHAAVEVLDHSRTFVCLANLKEDVKDKRMFKDAQDAFLADGDSALMMPVFFAEKVSRRKGTQSEVISSRNHGILQQMDQQIQSVITQKLSARLNFYDEQLVLLNRGFPGPLARGARTFYNIYVADSSTVKGKKQYKFDFYPKNYRNITFKGSFWVEDSSFALLKVEATLPNSANLNFVRDLEVGVSYQQDQAGDWHLESQQLQMKMGLNKRESKKKKNSYVVRKTMDFQPVLMTPHSKSPINTVALANISEPAILGKFHSNPRDSFETQAIKGIKTLQENRFVKFVDRLAAMGFTGYYNAGKIDIGPFYEFYRRNAVEGVRLTLTGRSSEQLSKTFSLGGYLGYGFKNKDFKYGAQVNLRLPTRNRGILSLRYFDDFYTLSRNKYIEFIQENSFSQGDGNPISTFTAAPDPYILGQEHLSLSLQLQNKQDVGLLLRPFYNRYKSTSQISFEELGVNSFQNAGVLLDARFSFHQKYDDIYFNRFYYGNGKPVIHLTTELGQNKVAQNTTSYAHFQASVKNRFVLGPATLRMLVEGGYILGKVPFPLLNMPRGSQSLGLGRYNYSLLNHASFASNVYTNAYFSLNGGGVVFNKIPLINRLNLRESVSFKAFYGQLNGGNESTKLPEGIFAAPHTPYMEVGMGVSNIFKFLRVEYVRRVDNHSVLDRVSSKNGIRMRFQVSF